MVRFLSKLAWLLEPRVLAPLIVAVSLVFLCGLNNILYTLVHNPRDFLAVSSRIGPVPRRDLQNFTELVIAFIGYSMVIIACYMLYSSERYMHRRSSLTYMLIASLVLLIMGILLIMGLYAQKTG